MKQQFKDLKNMLENAEGKVAAPIIMYLLGVPGFFCFLAWAFFFRGK